MTTYSHDFSEMKDYTLGVSRRTPMENFLSTEFVTTNLPEEDTGLHVLGISGSVLLFLITVTVLMGIRREFSQTPINLLIMMDCLLRLTKIPNILFTANVFNFWGITSPLFCSLRITVTYTTSLIPQLLYLSLALYRWTCVCRSSYVQTFGQRRTFFLRVSSTFTLLTLGLAVGAFYYKETNTFYRFCRGQTNLKADHHWDLPLSNPFRLLHLGSFLSNLLISPFLYIHIFFFRRSTGQSLGLNSQTLKARRRRNAVSARFNFLVWLSANIFLCVFLMVGIDGNNVVLYMVLESCCTPVLYYVGIESNRKRMRNCLRDGARMTATLVKKMNCLKSKVGPQEVQEVEVEEAQNLGQEEVLEVQEVEHEGEILEVEQVEDQAGQMFRRIVSDKKMTCLKSRVVSEEDETGPRCSTQAHQTFIAGM